MWCDVAQERLIILIWNKMPEPFVEYWLKNGDTFQEEFIIVYITPKQVSKEN
jgi:hypothetical protein